MEIASTITFLLRLWSDPSITMVAGANMPFATIKDAPNAAAYIFPLQFRRRAFELAPVDEMGILDTLDWVVKHLEITLKLMRGSPEFRLAAYAMDTGQFIENTALTLISLWGALEALFSPSTAELRFRVSALIASYVTPPGQERGTRRSASHRFMTNALQLPMVRQSMTVMICWRPSNCSGEF